MPRGDGTGPQGFGSKTGRAAGFCSGYNTPGFANQVQGQGARQGGGRGRRNMFYATGQPCWARFGNNQQTVSVQSQVSGVAREDELDYLTGQFEYLNNTLEDIKKRIDTLKSEKDN